MKKILVICCLIISALKGYGYTKDTFEVYFRFNVSKISNEAKKYIDLLIFNDKLIHGDKLIVLGFTDFVGGSSYNDTLSMQRAKNVREYLISSGFDEKHIKLCLGKGKIDRTNVTAKDGYAPDRKVQIIIDRSEAPATTAVHKGKIDINQLKVNQVFILNNIFFKLNQPVLLPESEPDLRNLLDFMREYPTITIRIEGHVCCMGPEEGVDSRYKGRNLSECRAEAIYNYLAEKGIAKDRMTYIGLANRNPIVKHEVTEEDRKKNRRVEIRILSK